MYVGARHKGVRCDGLWRACTEDRSNGLMGSTAVAWDMELSVGHATLARQRSLFSACVKLVDTARQDGKQRHLSPSALRIDRRRHAGQVSSPHSWFGEIGPICLTTAKCPLEARVSIGDVNCSTMCVGSVAAGQQETNWVDGASAATCWTQRVKDICPGAAHGNGEVALKEVASKPLSANLCKQVCAEYPELPAPVSEIITVAKEAVAVRKKLLDEALQTLRRVGSRSTAAEEPKRRCDLPGRLWWNI